MRHENREDSSKRDELARGRECTVAVAVMPSREQSLIESLQDVGLSWQSKSVKEHKSWESTGVDPFVPNPDPFNEGHFNSYAGQLPDTSFSSKRFPHSTGLDWHTVETDTLSTENDLYAITFRRTHINSYMHYRRQGRNDICYAVEFVDRCDASQNVVVESSQYPELGALFSAISKRIQ